ncbi:unnamed protein product, partial [Rotaria sp. Silwood1]
MLNYILRSQRSDLIYKYQRPIFYLIESLHRPLPSKDDSVSLTVFRGCQMTIFEVDELKTKIGEIIQNLPFLSTSVNRQIANTFAGNGFNENSYLVPVIMEIHLDTGQPMRPYALITNSAEEEVLFSPGIKFVLMSCRKLHNNGLLWHFKLNAIPVEQQKQIEHKYGKTFISSAELKWDVDFGRG